MTIEAVYRHGVFEPLEPVNLAEEQRVKLVVCSAEAGAVEAWLLRVKAIEESIVKRVGVLPDSTPDIAADRLR